MVYASNSLLTWFWFVWSLGATYAIDFPHHAISFGIGAAFSILLFITLAEAWKRDQTDGWQE